MSNGTPRAKRIFGKVKLAIIALALIAIAATAAGMGIARCTEWVGIMGLSCMLAAACSVVLIAIASRFLKAGPAIR